MRSFLNIFNLFQKLTRSKLFSPINNAYIVDISARSFGHDILEITMQRIRMVPAVNGALLNMH